MIEIKNFEINAPKNKRESRDYTFDKGLNYLKPADKAVFKFLSEKDKKLRQGEFFVDGHRILPTNEEDNARFIMMKINSQNISLVAAFLFNKEEVAERVQSLQNKLVELKELPIESTLNKQTKIDKILAVLGSFGVSFILIDENDPTNSDNLFLQQPVVEKYQSLFTIILLECESYLPTAKEKEEEDVLSLLDTDYIEIGGNQHITTVTVNHVDETEDDDEGEESQEYGSYLHFNFNIKQNKNTFLFVLNYLFKNIIVFFFLVLSYVGFTLVLLLTPQYFSVNNGMLGTMFSILSLVFFGLFIYNLYSCYDFIVKDNKSAQLKTKRRCVITTNYLIPIISTAIAIALYVLFVNNSEEFSFENYNIWVYVILGIGLLFTLIFPFIIKFLYKIVSAIISKIKDSE